MVICGHAQSGSNVSCPTGVFPAEVEPGDALPSCFSSCPVNKCPFLDLLAPRFCFALFVGNVV